MYRINATCKLVWILRCQAIKFEKCFLIKNFMDMYGIAKVYLYFFHFLYSLHRCHLVRLMLIMQECIHYTGETSTTAIQPKFSNTLILSSPSQRSQINFHCGYDPVMDNYYPSRLRKILFNEILFNEILELSNIDLIKLSIK